MKYNKKHLIKKLRQTKILTMHACIQIDQAYKQHEHTNT